MWNGTLSLDDKQIYSANVNVDLRRYLLYFQFLINVFNFNGVSLKLSESRVFVQKFQFLVVNDPALELLTSLRQLTAKGENAP